MDRQDLQAYTQYRGEKLSVLPNTTAFEVKIEHPTKPGKVFRCKVESETYADSMNFSFLIWINDLVITDKWYVVVYGCSAQNPPQRLVYYKVAELEIEPPNSNSTIIIAIESRTYSSGGSTYLDIQLRSTGAPGDDD